MTSEFDTESDFESRYRKIHILFHAFHQNFIQENTKDRHDMAAVGEVKAKILYIYDALKYFLSRCLDENATCESIIKDVKVLAGTQEDIELTARVQALLTDLCPLMFPWNAHIYPKVEHLFYLFGTIPYSPVKVDDAVPDSVAQ
jgi:hypothetical protein